jgi:hypothetical protein
LHAFEQGLHASVPAYHWDWSEKYPSGHAWQSSELEGSWALVVVAEEEEEEEEEEGDCADAHVYGLSAGQLVHDDAPRTAANRPPATSTIALSCAAAAWPPMAEWKESGRRGLVPCTISWAAYVPAGHALHAAIPGAANVPLGHGKHPNAANPNIGDSNPPPTEAELQLHWSTFQDPGFEAGTTDGAAPDGWDGRELGRTMLPGQAYALSMEGQKNPAGHCTQRRPSTGSLRLYT